MSPHHSWEDRQRRLLQVGRQIAISAWQIAGKNGHPLVTISDGEAAVQEAVSLGLCDSEEAGKKAWGAFLEDWIDQLGLPSPETPNDSR